MTDELLIERIRDAMHAEVEGLQPPAEVVQGVLAVRPGRRLGLSWLTPALAVAVAAVVAVVAVTSLGRRAPASRGTLSPVPVAARRLVSRLAVLRRPQRRPDVLPRWAVQQTESLSHQAKVIAGLSRLVGSVHLGQYGNARVYLVVETPPRFPVHRKHPGYPLLSPRLGDVASIAFVGAFREEAAINGPTVAAGAQGTAATPRGLTAAPSQVSYLWGTVAGIVPDGVTRVKWVFGGPGTGTPQLVVWPRVRDNVAIGRLPVLGRVLRGATWYTRSGRVLTRFSRSEAVAQQLTLEHLDRLPVAPALVRHFAMLRTRTDLARGVDGIHRGEGIPLVQPNTDELNLSQARFVPLLSAPRLSGTRAGLWVVPGSRGVSLLMDGQNVSTTGSVASALHGSLFVVSGDGKIGKTIEGLVPDGNPTVSVTLPHGASLVTRVTDNVYSMSVPANALALVVRDAAGQIVRFRLS